VLNPARTLLLALVLVLVACAGPMAPDPDLPLIIPSAAATLDPGAAPDRPSPPIPDIVPGGTPAPAGEDGSGYLGQRIGWAPCTWGGQRFQCARVLTPLDWAEPEAMAITLFLLRSPATKWPKAGTLFVNPGGPGEAGSTMAAWFARDGLEHYDIVGWDPRGTGQSAAVECAGDQQLDEYFEVDNSPDDEFERQGYIKANRELGLSCLEHSGRLLEHISTVDTVHDLELLRRLVGDDRLNYFGYSYGTNIGSRYAHLFPERVGRMVLDGAVNVTGSDEIIQAAGFERALNAFADWCAAQQCELGSDRATVIRSVTDLFDDLDARPVPVGERQLTQSLAVTGVLALLYGSGDQYQALLTAITRAQSGDGAALLQRADLYNDRYSDGEYGTASLAFSAIRCLDKPDEGLAGADRRAMLQNEKAPVLGPYFGPDYTCPTWPVEPRPQAPPVRAQGAPPILVIGSTGDSATPYEYAVGMVGQLESGVLLTYDGPGHGAYGGTSACVDQAVVAYLTGDVPMADQTCG
jgi:pimeloyl-ACP methyl ester carboxylesterase